MRCPTTYKCDNNVMADSLPQIEFFTEKFLYFQVCNEMLDIPVGIHVLCNIFKNLTEKLTLFLTIYYKIQKNIFF